MDPRPETPDPRPAGWDVTTRDNTTKDRKETTVRVFAYGANGPTDGFLAAHGFGVTVVRVRCSACGRDPSVFVGGHDPRGCAETQSHPVRGAVEKKRTTVRKVLPPRAKGERRTAWRARNALL
jgi:hypothetical protein